MLDDRVSDRDAPKKIDVPIRPPEAPSAGMSFDPAGPQSGALAGAGVCTSSTPLSPTARRRLSQGITSLHCCRSTRRPG